MPKPQVIDWVVVGFGVGVLGMGMGIGLGYVGCEKGKESGRSEGRGVRVTKGG